MQHRLTRQRALDRRHSTLSDRRIPTVLSLAHARRLTTKTRGSKLLLTASDDMKPQCTMQQLSAQNTCLMS